MVAAVAFVKSAYSVASGVIADGEFVFTLVLVTGRKLSSAPSPSTYTPNVCVEVPTVFACIGASVPSGRSTAVPFCGQGNALVK